MLISWMSLWPSAEHILELQTIMRFLEAILDGQLYQAPLSIARQPFGSVDPDEVLKFTQDFPGWAAQSGSAASPAARALAYCGSSQEADGMVVAASNLNSIKTRVRFNRTNPVH